jgi:hypothetical protein
LVSMRESIREEIVENLETVSGGVNSSRENLSSKWKKRKEAWMLWRMWMFTVWG